MAKQQSKRAKREAERRARKRRQQTVRGSLVAVAIAALAAVALVLTSGDEAAALAPNFALENTIGETVQLADYAGQPVALIFMHTY